MRTLLLVSTITLGCWMGPATAAEDPKDMLNIETSDVSMETLKAFAEAFPIADLDAAAAGS